MKNGDFPHPPRADLLGTCPACLTRLHCGCAACLPQPWPRFLMSLSDSSTLCSACGFKGHTDYWEQWEMECTNAP